MTVSATMQHHDLFYQQYAGGRTQQRQRCSRHGGSFEAHYGTKTIFPSVRPASISS
jgi:hypothetical protein